MRVRARSRPREKRSSGRASATATECSPEVPRAPAPTSSAGGRTARPSVARTSRAACVGGKRGPIEGKRAKRVSSRLGNSRHTLGAQRGDRGDIAVLGSLKASTSRSVAASIGAGLLLLVCAAPRRLRGAFPPTTTAVRPAGHPTRPLAAARVAVTEMCMNHVRPAITLAEEGVDLARQLGYENDEPGYLGLQAWFAALRGREADCRRCRRRSAAPRPRGRYRLGDERGAPRLTLLELVLGDAREAIEQLDQFDQGPLPATAVLGDTRVHRSRTAAR
jgi:hypothetical protein